MVDEETQVLRKQAFEYLFDLEVKKATRYQYFLALLFLELDVPRPEGESNTQGHFGVDQLKVFADLLRDELRSTDVIGKLSDGRLSVLLHHADDVNTQRVGDRLRKRIEDYAFTHGNYAHRTVSIGGACFPSGGNFPEDLRDVATRMIERAKEDGGNKIYMAG